MKILAHKIHYLDKVYTMSVVEIEDGRVRSISPYERETESTRFISGAIQLLPTATGIEICKVKSSTRKPQP